MMPEVSMPSSYDDRLSVKALEYARNGWPVLPVRPSGKKPLTKHGVNDATTNSDTIRGWWEEWPEANIGLAVPREYLVVDIDSEEALQQLKDEDLTLPETTTGRTARGYHFWYATNGAEVKNGVDVFPGVDLRSAGGYVVVPPSVHETGALYEWEVPLTRDMIAPAPQWLLERLRRRSTVEGVDQKSLNVAQVLAGVPEGQRDDALFRLACKLRHAGVPREWGERLVGEAAENCTPPFPQKEAYAKVANAYDRYRPGEGPFVSFGSTLPEQFRPFRELPPIRPEAPELPPNLLPRRLRPWIVDIGERMQVAPEFVAVPTLTALSAVVGQRIGIHPKAHDDWVVVPNLWGGILARPGKLKSPVLAETLKPIRHLEATAHEHHRRRKEEYDVRLDSLKMKEAALKDLLKRAHGGRGKERSPEEFELELVSIRREIGELEGSLVARRYIVNDCVLSASVHDGR